MRAIYVGTISLAVSLLLGGCDRVSYTFTQAQNQGSLDGVVNCIEHNSGKKDLLSETYIREQCIEKISNTTTKDLTPGKCSATVRLNEKFAWVDLSDYGCKNKSEKIITSVTTKVTVANIPRESNEGGITRYSTRFIGTKDGLFILPNSYFNTTVYADVGEEYSEITSQDIPFCSDLKDGDTSTCKYWTIASYGYLDPSIE